MNVTLNTNCLKFSKRENDCISNGILNQNPFVISKKEAFNFTYNNVDKVQLAQLLARRDLRNLKTEYVSDTTTLDNSDGEIEKKRKPVLKNKKMTGEDRVSSVKRVPGPQTPNKVNKTRKDLPVRSLSPPVKDNDTTWKPKNDTKDLEQNKAVVKPTGFMENYPKGNGRKTTQEKTEFVRLQRQIENCSNKLSRLEKHLLTQSSMRPPFSLRDPQNALDKNVKSKEDLFVLTNKLQELMSTQLPSSRDICDIRQPFSEQQNISSRSHTPSNQVPTNDVSIDIDKVLSRIDCLALEMDRIRSRWCKISYENVSVCSDSDEDDNQCSCSIDYRFTKRPAEKWEEFSLPEQSKTDLNVPRQTVIRLDNNRKQHEELMMKFKCLPKNNSLKIHKIVEWFADDFIDEIVDDVVAEIDRASSELVEAVLNAELNE